MSPDAPFKVGDIVFIDQSVRAVVVMASENGRSIVLGFEAVIDVKGTGGVYIGSMPLSRTDDGRWVELFSGGVIDISRGH